METSRVINGRYQLQRLVKQTPFCTVYQGIDQRLQRAVAVKSVLPTYVPAYKTAVKMTANFSHPHIVGLYDLLIEQDALYVVQEYVDGDTFEILVRNQLSTFEVAELGWQMCLALMYSGSASRRVCHGDLTPAAVARDRAGNARLNNFALTADLAYFQKWSILGADGVPLLETELPWGQQSDARKADDTRAVGLLLYQLVTGSLEPPADGRLRFSRGTPAELCEVIARAVVRQHPQYINTPDALYTQLKPLALTLEPAIPRPAQLNTYQLDEPPVPQFSPAGVGRLASALPSREAERSGRSLSSYSAKMSALETTPPTALTGAPLYPGEQQLYSSASAEDGQKRSTPALLLLLFGVVAFLLFFAIGYVLGHALIH